MGASAALIKYLGLMSDASNFGHYTLYQHNLSAYMRLDASALRALNLMPGPNDGANRTMSLFGLLNKCKTALGTRLLAQWLKQPLLDLGAIQERQTLVEAFVMDTEVRQTLQEDHLRAIPDLSRLSKRFQRQVATLEDVVRAYQVVIRLPGLIETVDAIQDDRHRDLIQATYVHPLQTHYANLAKLQEMVEATIDLAALEEHQFVIKPDFDDNLKNYRKRMDDLRDAMSAEHIRVGNDLKQDTEKKLKLEQQNVYGWCLRLTRNVLPHVIVLIVGSWLHSRTQGL
jgi:DNA mismatch repair protein MSH2